MGRGRAHVGRCRAALFYVLCAPTLGAAHPSDNLACAAGTTPPGATAPTATQSAALERVAQAVHFRTALGIAPLQRPYCLTPSAVFLSADWASSEPLVLMPRVAYALGVYMAQLRPSEGPRPLATTDAAARFTGCALERLGYKGDELTTAVLDLAALTTPPTATALFFEGVDSCK